MIEIAASKRSRNDPSKRVSLSGAPTRTQPDTRQQEWVSKNRTLMAVSRSVADAIDGSVDSAAGSDAELLNMATFKLCECAARLRALAGRARTGPTRELLASVSQALDGHAYALGAMKTSSPSSRSSEPADPQTPANRTVK